MRILVKSGMVVAADAGLVAGEGFEGNEFETEPDAAGEVAGAFAVDAAGSEAAQPVRKKAKRIAAKSECMRFMFLLPEIIEISLPTNVSCQASANFEHFTLQYDTI
jgi:hypothetical protein